MSRSRTTKDPFETVVEAHALLREDALVGPFANSIVLARSTSHRARRHWVDVSFRRRVLLPSSNVVADVTPNIAANLDARTWYWIFSRIAMHLALNHAEPKRNDFAWHVACWAVAEAMLRSGRATGATRPEALPPLPAEFSYRDERALAERLSEGPIPPDLLALALGPKDAPYWTFAPSFTELTETMRASATRTFATALRDAANRAVAASDTMGNVAARTGPAARARAWFVSNYPLLGALASRFSLVEDAAVCERYGIRVAAVDSALGEIYVNPHCALGEDEMIFVLAHEMLHVGLRHDLRLRGRDPWLWNVACDFVINAWLIEMRCGIPPERVGYLFDAELSAESAEAVYDRIARDLRIQRRIRKLRGWAGDAPDLIVERPPEWWHAGGADLDAFYRRALTQGLELHRASGRGTLPGGLVEEISALEQRPIPWDVTLGQWLDEFFDPLETRRSFALASRRQASTPDIVRAGRRPHERNDPSRVFGVVLDTSGSMDRIDLARALGAIRAYALARDVFRIRLIQVDVVVHDNGFIDADDLLERFDVRGRGGTELMPGVTMLEQALDFPKSAPILIITDGFCDHVRSLREHAFLLPAGRSLPFRTLAPIFTMDGRRG